MPIDTLNDVITINKVPCYTVKRFAQLTDRTENTIRYLVNKGNSIRKLKVIKIDSRLFIPSIELTEYSFLDMGNGAKPYHFTETGEKVFA